MVTASDDGTARVWPLHGSKLQTMIRQRTQVCLDTSLRESSLGETPAVAQRRNALCELSRLRCPPPEVLEGTSLRKLTGPEDKLYLEKLLAGATREQVGEQLEQCLAQ